MNTSSQPCLQTHRMLLAYMQLARVTKPIGFWLLLWPTYWGLWVASHGHLTWHLLVAFTAGTWLMRTAGCIINDCADRNFDAHVARTRTRPLACGAISLHQALMALAICLAGALACLMALPSACWPVAMLALGLSSLYPFCKRWLHTPQVVLGIAFSMGIPMAFTALHQPFSTNGWLLWASAALWPVAYDSMYALMDQKDDQRIGVRSTALLWGNATPRVILWIETVMAALWLAMAYRLGMRLTFVFAALLFLGFIVFNHWTLSQKNPSLQKLFNQQQYLGMGLWLCLLVHYS